MRTSILNNGQWTEQVSDTFEEMTDAATDDGQLLFSNPALLGNLHYDADYLVNKLGVVNSDAELATQKASLQSFQEVYKTYRRFSVSIGNPAEPAYPDELLSWAYVASNDSILCTKNTNGYVGLVGLERYSNYTFEVNLSSTNQDDDTIGLVVAYANVDGISHTLSICRQFQTAERQFYLLYLNGKGESQYLGAVGSTVLTQVASANGGWGSAPAGTNIRVTRTGTQFTFETTQLGSTVYVDAAKFTSNLTAYPDLLTLFGDGASIGYMAASQDQSTYKVLQRPGSRLNIYDIRDGSIWLYDASAWTRYTDRTSDYVRTGRHYFSPLTGKLWYCYSGSSLTPVATVAPVKATSAEVIAGTRTDVWVDAADAKAAWAAWGGN